MLDYFIRLVNLSVTKEVSVITIGWSSQYCMNCNMVPDAVLLASIALMLLFCCAKINDSLAVFSDCMEMAKDWLAMIVESCAARAAINAASFERRCSVPSQMVVANVARRMRGLRIDHAL